MPVDELNDLLHARLPESDDWDSAGGLLLNLLGHVPANGESIDGGGLVAHRRAGPGSADWGGYG